MVTATSRGPRSTQSRQRAARAAGSRLRRVEAGERQAALPCHSAGDQRALRPGDGLRGLEPLAVRGGDAASHVGERRPVAAPGDLDNTRRWLKGGQGRAVGFGQRRWLARRLAIQQALGPLGVKLDHPIPHDLQRHGADPRGFAAGGAIVDRRQRQEPTNLRRIFGPPRRRSKRPNVKVMAKGKRLSYGDVPMPATLNQKTAASGNPLRESPSE